MASFYEFLRDTGDAIQRNVGDPYARALTGAIRTGNYNPFDIIANAEINRRATKIVEDNRLEEEARQKYLSLMDPERRPASSSFRYQDSTGKYQTGKITEEDMDAYFGTQGKTAEESSKESTEDNSDDYVYFSYGPGDTFGQKILDLGLATENGLWGTDGDVNFYTRQLIDQGALDANGNVKLGQTFKLRRRK